MRKKNPYQKNSLNTSRFALPLGRDVSNFGCETLGLGASLSGCETGMT